MHGWEGMSVPPWANAFRVQHPDGRYAATRFLDGKRTRVLSAAFVWHIRQRRPLPVDLLLEDRRVGRPQRFTLVWDRI